MLEVINNVNDLVKITRKKNLKIVIAGDTHVGHQEGYLAPNMQTKKGVVVRQSKTQKERHSETIRHLQEIGEIDILILTGDLCEGKQVRMAGIGLNATDTDTMVKWTSMTILDWCTILKPKYIVITKGTDYHTSVGIGGDLDYQVASMLSASGYKVYYGIEINVKLGELVWYLRHYYPTVSVNRTMPLEKMYRFKSRDYTAERLKILPDVMLFAHIHLQLGPIKIEQRTYAMTAPALKGKDSYMKSKGYGWEPDIGILFLEQTGKYIDHKRFYRTV